MTLSKGRRLLIIHHEDEHRVPHKRHLLHVLIPVWKEAGIEVIQVFGTREAPPADVAFLHVDLSVIPPAYLEFARRYPVVATIGAEGCWFEAAQPGVPGVFGSLLAAAAHVTSQGLWPRLKVCKNSTCYAGFYDKTRNLSGQFCGPACNSQASMRAYRQRRKGA